MLLKNLIKKISKNKGRKIVSGLATDSRKVKKNFIFFAIKGNKSNGENFIKNAITNGASVIVCSKNYQTKHKNTLIIKASNVRNNLSKIASKFYLDKPKNIIAVTGTNGKTSVADLFYQLLRINKIPAASIGTLGIKFNDKVLKTNLTSPNAINIHKYLNFLKKKKIENVIIEASSHGLDQKRLHNINFKAGIFTNFSQDHLDYHRTMDSYLKAKLTLFDEILKRKTTIISDKEIKPFSNIKKISKEKNLKLIEIEKGIEKIKNNSNYSSSDFKIKNLAMAIEAAKLCGLKKKFIFKSIKKLKDVNGRLELVKNFSNESKVFIDYAHTPDALSKTLNYLKNKFGNNISLVFGCGGDRDKKKRPFMAKIANEICKKIYITDDNPRNENPKKIRKELSKYISTNKCFDIGNRTLAIKKAIQNASFGEIILIAGKGHEEQQIYKNRIKNISDKKIVKLLKINNKINKRKENFLQNQTITKELLGKNIKTNFNGLSIDSRQIKKDNLFLTLKGKKNDGNKFINDALKNGAGCVVSSLFKTKSKKFVRVKKPQSFLYNFAKLKRKNTRAKVISITGSAGKTSLKNLLSELISKFGTTFSSPQSFNNHYGVPISLSNLSFDDKFGIFEVGMSKAGEIRNLSKLVKPNIAVITNIGEAHLENFKNINEIAKAKSEIIENIESGGTIILNRDDKFFNYLSKKARKYKIKIVSFGKNRKSDICINKITKKKNYFKLVVKFHNHKLDLVIKDLNIHNVLASLAVLKELKLNLNRIKTVFKNIEPSEGRGKEYLIYRHRKKFRFIDESYNANPLSVKSAISRFSAIKKKNFKKYLILGDMLELGSKSKIYHQKLSKVINSSDIDKVFIKGKKTIFTYKQLNKEKRGNVLQDIKDIDFILKYMISNNDYLMIKGSNATGLNEFSKRLIKGI